MAAPNRSEVVKRVVVGLANFTRVSEAELEDRRRRFLPRIIAAMPAEDAGSWGPLIKTEKTPPYIPSDILVWRPTMEHIDVLTADRMPDGTFVIVPIWKNHGVIGEAKGTEKKRGVWLWKDVKAANIPDLPRVDPPAPPAPPSEPDDADNDALFERMLIQGIERIADGVEDMAIAMKAIADRIVKI